MRLFSSEIRKVLETTGITKSSRKLHYVAWIINFHFTLPSVTQISAADNDCSSFFECCWNCNCSNVSTSLAGSRAKGHWSWRSTTKGCSRPSYATSGRRPAPVHTGTTASSLTASESSAPSSAILATRPRSAGWSSLATRVLTATGATSATPSLSRRGLWTPHSTLWWR